MEGLPAHSVLTPGTAARTLGVTRAAARGLETLHEAGAPTAQSISPGRRAYVAPAVINTITWAERRLASTRFDTRVTPPVQAPPLLLP